MRKLIPYMAVLMAVSLVFLGSACSKNNNRYQAGADRTNLKDSDVKTVIKDRLNADPQLRAADLGVSADLDNNEVKLSGTVNSEQLRSKAIQIAKSAMPGFTITDTIDVKPGSMARANYDNDQSGNNRGENNGSASDDSIRSEIKLKLSKSNLSPQDDINVSVDKGVAKLTGKVGSENERTRIQRVVEGVQGVNQVDNKLEIRNQGAPDRSQTQSEPAPAR